MLRLLILLLILRLLILGLLRLLVLSLLILSRLFIGSLGGVLDSGEGSAAVAAELFVIVGYLCALLTISHTVHL